MFNELRVIIELRKLWNGMLILLLFGVAQTAFAQIPNHTYPRTAVQHFGKAPEEWYARFDMNLLPWSNEAKIRRIKQINPKSLFIWVDGWTSYSSRNPVINYVASEAPAWFAVDSKGEVPQLSWGTLMDMSSLCPKVGGKRFVDRHPEELLKHVDINLVDGIGSDWCWGRPHGLKDLDLDRNGKNDFDEHGRNWVDERWLEGVEAFIANLRQQIGPNKLIWVNSGQFHNWGWTNANGLDIERQSGFLDWDFYWRQYQKFMEQAREPRILLMDVRADWEDPIRPDNTKNYFKLMRFMLTATMLGDGYYNYSPLEGGEHHFQAYYDEFDLNLGYPTQPAQQLNNGVYVRFFDLGVSICNASGNPVTVGDSDLRSLNGYAGPYSRFNGGQDHAHNNGQKLGSVELWGGYNRRSNGDILIGDGIILVKEPRAVVSDLMVDVINLDTSPGSDEAKLTGGWQLTEDGDLFWNQNTDGPKGWYPHAIVSGGDGSQTATYSPSIGVPGKYEVFEWHGRVSGQLATNVPVTIYHSGGTTTTTVDQTRNQGALNSLGVYTFPAGRSAKVVISNKANGIVMADMIIFGYRGEDGNQDTEAPSPPTGVRTSSGE
ncbi:MAG TPA: putative glycoside hydrolase [bacterium]